MVNIKPSTAIRNNYNGISKLCKQTGEPVYLTKNGEGGLVVMDINAFVKRESMLRLREQLMLAEEGRVYGKTGHSVEDVSTMMKEVVREVVDGNERKRYDAVISNEAVEVLLSHARFMAQVSETAS